MALFSRIIKCLDCTKSHKGKLIRGKTRIYVCSTYDNLGKSHCRRNKVDESFLIELLSIKYKGIIDHQELRDKVHVIEANDDKIIIRLMDGSEPIIASNTFLQL